VPDTLTVDIRCVAYLRSGRTASARCDSTIFLRQAAVDCLYHKPHTQHARWYLQACRLAQRSSGVHATTRDAAKEAVGKSSVKPGEPFVLAGYALLCQLRMIS
jgi:hypothetical protein